MVQMTAAIYQPFLAALLSGLEYMREYDAWLAISKDERYRPAVDLKRKLYLQDLRALRCLTDYWAYQLEETMKWLLRTDLGSRDNWLDRQARAFGEVGFDLTAQSIARHMAVASRRARTLRALGDADGADEAEQEAERVAEGARERRVIVDPKSEKQARAEEQARKRAQRERERGQRSRPAVRAGEQEQLDYAA